MPWCIDIHCDHEWVVARDGHLGELRSTVGGRSESLGIDIDFRFYGDELSIRHVRVCLGTEDQGVADRYARLNMNAWVAAIETAMMSEIETGFRVARLGVTDYYMTSSYQGDVDMRAPQLKLHQSPQPPVDFSRMAAVFAAWNTPDLGQHLLYFRRLIDRSMPLDVRWLNGYRFLEWHFARGGDLSKSSEWRALLGRHSDIINPLKRGKQTLWGYMEEARALAAHAGMDRRSEAEKQHDPHNAMFKTMPVIHQLVMTVLNEHPAFLGFGLSLGVQDGRI